MNTKLSLWLSGQYGRDKRFKSARDLSLAAGLSNNYVGNVIAHGKGRPAELKKLADVLGVKPSFVLELAGMIETEKEADPIPSALSELVAKWELLSDEWRDVVSTVAQQALRSVREKASTGGMGAN